MVTCYVNEHGYGECVTQSYGMALGLNDSRLFKWIAVFDLDCIISQCARMSNLVDLLFLVCGFLVCVRLRQGKLEGVNGTHVRR